MFDLNRITAGFARLRQYAKTPTGKLVIFVAFIVLFMIMLFACMPEARAQSSDATATSGSTSGAMTNTRVENALVIDNTQHERSTVRTAPGHGLAAATNSFSSDYCGGTAQVGASGLGWSLGGSKQAYDKNCQALRRVERWGQLAAQARDLGLQSEARRAYQMAIWTLCTIEAKTQDACVGVNLVREEVSP